MHALTTGFRTTPAPCRGDRVQWFMEGLPRSGNDLHRTFNPSAVQYRGQTIVACRVGRGPQSSIWLGRLDGRLQPVRKSFVETLAYGEAGYEDPRLFVSNHKLMLSCAVSRPGTVNQAIVELTRDFRVERMRELQSPQCSPIEKNWIFFGDEPHVIYHAGRGSHEIYRLDGETISPAYAEPHGIHWLWGQMRGGTNVVEHEGLNWTFFHSSKTLHTAGSLHYFMGAYAFDPEPPFALAGWTPAPLYMPPDSSEVCKPDKKRVIFPGGLILHDDHWCIFSGYNDERVVVSQIAHDTLVSRMYWNF